MGHGFGRAFFLLSLDSVDGLDGLSCGTGKAFTAADAEYAEGMLQWGTASAVPFFCYLSILWMVLTGFLAGLERLSPQRTRSTQRECFNGARLRPCLFSVISRFCGWS